MPMEKANWMFLAIYCQGVVVSKGKEVVCCSIFIDTVIIIGQARSLPLISFHLNQMVFIIDVVVLVMHTIIRSIYLSWGVGLVILEVLLFELGEGLSVFDQQGDKCNRQQLESDLLWILSLLHRYCRYHYSHYFNPNHYQHYYYSSHFFQKECWKAEPIFSVVRMRMDC